MISKSISSRISSFAPVVDENTKILILGTLPSPISLQRNQYYGNPNNTFWPIIYDLFSHTTPDDDYQARCRFLLEHHLGLWDVFGSANREGAADAKIQNATVNDFSMLLRQYPQIQRLVFNGQKALKHFKATYPDICNQIDCVRVMSTSPAFALQYEVKLQNWREGLTDLKQ
jgi:TDG/mug DNA glycosylase family protein